MSIGWSRDKNYIGNAAKNPVEFAYSVLELVNKHHFDGFDIDYESASVSNQNMYKLSEGLRKVLSRKEKLLTITPAQTSGLNPKILELYDYVMPQTYQHDGNGTKAEPYVDITGWLV